MKMFKKILTGLSIGSFAFLAGCTVSGSDDEIKIGVDPVDFGEITSEQEFLDAWDNLTDEQKEFEYAYEILDMYYLFAHSDSLKPKGSPWYNQLAHRKNYIGQGVKNLYTRRAMPDEFLDIYYMYMSMNDMFTQYIDPTYASYDEFMEEFNARDTISDIGYNLMAIHRPDTVDAIVIAQIFTGSAAENSKLRVNDTVLTVNGTICISETLCNVLGRASVGTKIPVTIARDDNGERVEFTDTLSIVPYISPSVTYKVIDSVAVISIIEFAQENTPSKEGTYGEFLQALKATENTKATVIDLRGNPGGDEDQCINISTEMLPKGSIISVEYKPLDATQTDEQVIYGDTVRAEWDGIAKDRYLVFMADSGSASCSEYTLAAVLGNRHSPLIGQNTYGKGIGYGIAPTYLNGSAMITVAISYDLNKETYHMRGFAPDIALDEPQAMLDTAIAIAKEGKMVRTAGYSSEILPRYFEPLMKDGSSMKKIPGRKDLGRYKVLKIKK